MVKVTPPNHPVPVQLYGLGQFGLNLDIKPHLMAPEAWSNANNVIFTKKGVQRSRGHEQVFGTMSVTPEFIMNVPGFGSSFWIYTSLLKAYVYEAGVHTNITRQTMSVDVDYAAVTGQDWAGTILGGIPILNNGVDLPQWWQTLSPSTKLQDMTAFVGPGSTSLRTKVLKAFGQYLIALNVTEDSDPQPTAIYVSSKADVGTLPASWDYTDPTVDAMRLFLTDDHGGDILDAGLLGDIMIVYREYSTHYLRITGGDQVITPAMLLIGSGLLARKCFCSFKDGTAHFVVTADDIIVHQGTRETKSIAQDRCKAIFTEIDPTNYVNAFAFENRVTRECWFCYPTIGNTYPNKVLRWNYIDDTISLRDFDGVSMDYGNISDASTDVWDTDSGTWDSDSVPWSTESRLKQVYVNRSKAFALETGDTFGGTPFTAFCERTGLAIDGKDRQGNPRASLTSRKLLSRVWPKLSGGTTVRVLAGSQEQLEGPVTWDGGQTFDMTTQRYLDSAVVPVNGQLLAVRYEFPNSEPTQLEGHDLYITKLGEQ